MHIALLSTSFGLCLFAALLSGCAMSTEQKTNMARYSQFETTVISTPPGARIIVGQEYVGNAPMKIKLREFCNKFGLRSMVVTAIPTTPGACPQAMQLSCDFTPSRILFEMRICQQRPGIDVNIKRH